jgi:N-acetylglucosaminyldiphosphoundecaprenol N-acetyl-beta-D-mannosaminyltransferase
VRRSQAVSAMSKQLVYDKVEILGIDVDAVTQAQAITYITERASDKQSPPIYVVKPYVEFIDRAVRDETVKTLINQAELVLADGVALVWAAAFLYAGKRSSWRFIQTLAQIIFSPEKLYWPLDKPMAGINFTWPLLEAATLQNLRVYFVGTESTEQILHAAETVRQEITGLKLVGTHSGRDATVDSGRVSRGWIEQLALEIEATSADLILVGMGFPLQEEVISVLTGKLSHGVLVGEGGTFDYEQFGGTRPKAPLFMQRIGLEWLWRLIVQPSRWRRQLAVPRFIWRVWRNR